MKKVKPMKVSLTQKEIQRAVLAYVAGQGINLKDKDVAVEFTATRSRETGIIAELTINDNADDADFIPAATLIGADDLAPTETKAVEPTNLFAATSSEPAVVEADDTPVSETSAPAEVQVEEAKEAPAAAAGASTESLFG